MKNSDNSADTELEEDDSIFPASINVPGQVTSRQAQANLEQVLDQMPWRDEYDQLLAERDQEGRRRWDWRKAVYIAWASMPQDRRWPETQAELARDVLGLRSDRTIRQWREKDSGLDQRVAEYSGAHRLFKYRAAVFEALAEVATTPDPKGHPDRRLFLELTGDYTPKQKVEQSGPEGGPISHKVDTDSLSEAELDQLILNLQTALGQGAFSQGGAEPAQ